MLFDSLFEYLSNGSATSSPRAGCDLVHYAAGAILLAFLGLFVDYGHMLWLRSKLVSYKISDRIDCCTSTDTEKPPGPRPWPIVGNTFMLPDTKPWFWFEELSKKYNAPLITIWIGR